jgi:hypothetical protein
MHQGSDSSNQKILFALSLLRDSLSEWNKFPTQAEFVPPAVIPALHERCERILALVATDEIRSLPSDVRLLWFRRIEGIRMDVEKAFDARRQFLHPLATAERRKWDMFVVEHHLDEAHKEAKKIAREMEQDRLVRKRRARQEKPHDVCARALIRAVKFLAPERWCKGAEARDRRGRRTYFNDPYAHSFSIVGGILATTQFLAPDQQFHSLRFVGYAAKCRNTRELQEWNDKLGTTHADVRRTLLGAVRLMARNGLNWQTEFDL